jgi:biopolymer transport protein ExbD
MKTSRRARRMAKHHDRTLKRNAVLNMVSLMDIFTILVFFLLVNATSSEVLPSPKNIVLPEAAAEKLPALNLVVAVDDQVIRLQGKPVVMVKDVLASDQKTIRPLFDALREAATTVKDITDKNGVTIMGDREIPYGLLKKIMLTCAGAEYTNISFAVTQKAPET